ncbi:MAG: FixH family protein [Woeseiaceae bacterium]|nr:FixH family protein [Woeseiaceae bacterium]
MVREDTQPWYRQFWPWFIIALPASAVIAGLTTLWISMQTTDSLVLVPEQGVKTAADRQVAAARLASELGLAAAIDIDLTTGVVTAVMRSGDLDNAPATLEFEMSHPTIAARDHLITLNKAMPDADGNPVWVGHFVALPQGRYYAVLKSDDWRLSAEWHDDPTLTLRTGNDEPR